MRPPPECNCMELGSQVCSSYEAWCSEVQAEGEWRLMTVDEQTEVITSNAAYSLSRTFGHLLAPPEPF